MSLNLITVGKLKNKELESLCEDYQKRLNPKLHIFEVKASAQNPEKESSEVIKKLGDIGTSNARHILLTEWGDEFESVKFSSWLDERMQKFSHVNFIIAGAEGPDQKLKDFCHDQLSLSQLTLPHKIARLVLIEQIYRAQTIKHGHPYHN